MESLARRERAEVPMQARTRYWLDFAKRQHAEEMRLLLHEAKLSVKPHKKGEGWHGWNNVIKHMVGEAAAMRILCKTLEIPEQQAEKLEATAFVHDAQKREDAHPDDPKNPSWEGKRLDVSLTIPHEGKLVARQFEIGRFGHLPD